MIAILSVGMNLLLSFLTISILGALLGFALAFASRFFAVKKDEKAVLLEAALPGSNCGGCGFTGCSAYADAMVRGAAGSDLCALGGPVAAAKMALILGVEARIMKDKMVTQVHCRGGRSNAKYKFGYRGLDDCNGAHMLFGGDKHCVFACLGLGSCIKICPVRAIGRDAEGLVWVDKDLCTGCGKCVEICPTKVIRWLPYTADYLVACNSTDPGAETKNYCSVGCTGCRLCEKKAPEGGFAIENNLARLNYAAGGRRLPAANACPPNCIILNKVAAERSPEPDRSGLTNGEN